MKKTTIEDDAKVISKANEIKEILDSMRVHNEVKNDWNVYQIGCVSSPLNFASQQAAGFQVNLCT